MKRFQFKLQRLLEFREAREDVLLTELGVARNNYEMERVRLSEMQTAEDTCRDKLKDSLSSGSAEEILNTYNYLNHLMVEESKQQSRVVKAEELKNIKTNEVIDASKECKVLENLKDRESSEYKRLVESDEQKFLDDLASFKRKDGPMQSASKRGV